MTLTQAKRVCRFSLPANPVWGGTLMPQAVRMFARHVAGKAATPFHAKACLLDLLSEYDDDVHVFVTDRNFIALVVEERGGAERGGVTHTWRVLDFAPTVQQPSCRKCGCTEDLACAEGCEWVEADLCSACAD